MENKRFAGLDGLRFVSITFVVLHHLFTFKKNFGYHAVNAPVLGVIGTYGIHFFFMGSGFLITYLLLYEARLQNKISLKHFYIRRVLRIWPAYFLLIFLMLAIYRNDFFRIPYITDQYIAGNDLKSNTLYLAGLPHLAPFVNSTSPYVHQTYTIGIEEQFYISWGLLFFLFPSRFKLIMVVLAVGGPFMNLIHHYLFSYLSSVPDPSKVLVFFKQGLYYLKYSKVSTFAIGSLLGYAFFNKAKWIQVFRLKTVQIAVYLLFGVSVVYSFLPAWLQFEYMALLTGFIMIAATFREESLFNYCNPILEFLGKVSYGIYLFHIFAIVFSIKLLGGLLNLPLDTPFQTVVLCITTLSMSVLFGYLSYEFFEKHFLMLKKRFMRV